MTNRRIHILSLATLFPDVSRPNFGIFVERSLAALSEQPDVDLTIVAPVGIPPWPLSRVGAYAALAKLPAQEIWDGLAVHRPRFTLLPGIARRNAVAVAAAVLPLAKELQEERRLDVIDAQFFWPDGPAAAILSEKLGVPFSIKARGADISHWAHHKPTAPMIVSAADKASGLLAVASTMGDDMAAVGMDRDKIRVHYTGLDASRFFPRDRAAARQRWQIAPDATVILTVGALIPRKGQSLVIDALKHFPDSTHYVMAGIGPDEDALRSQAEAAGLSQRVRFLGGVPNDILPDLYAAADVMALPSASEGLANAWVEALGCGVPLLLSDIPPAHELLHDNDAGLVTKRNPEAIARGIATLLSRPHDRQAIAAATHQRFNWARNGQELADHLRQIAAHKR